MKDELLIKYLLKETDDAENTEVQSWVTENKNNQEYYAQFKHTWDASKSLELKSEIDEDLAWKRFQLKVSQSAGKAALVRPLNNYTWLKVAASLAVIVAIWFGYTLLSPAKYTELSAGNNIFTDTLPDGSEITMNKNSAISYASNFTSNRNVKLKTGDVFFDVTHDKSKPFVIDIENVAVIVVGTSFNIRHENDETEVNVESGIVKVSIGKREVELRKGERVLVRKSDPELVKEKNTDHVYNYYHSGAIEANNTPILKVIGILQEIYGAEIKTSDPSIAKMNVTTTLPIRYTLDDNIKTLCNTMDLKAQRNGKEIILSKSK
jgi:transmembrane sensor